MNNIFVYGTLRKGELNHHYLKKSEFIGVDYVYGFIMLDFGDYPVIFESLNDKKVLIEIYRITDYTLNKIDILEEYYGELDSRNLYIRKPVKSVNGFKGYIYYGVSADMFKGAIVIDSGDWKQR